MSFSSKQLSFDLPVLRGWRSVPSQIGRSEYYLAVLPTEEIAQKATLFADRLHQQYSFPVKPRDWKLLHLSACGLGCYEESAAEILAAVDEAIDTIRMEPFVLVLDCLMNFKTPDKHIVLTGEEGRNQFCMLHALLAKSLRLGCFPIRYESGLQPHTTLFYKGKDIEMKMLPDPFRIEVSEVVLVQSLIGRGTHVHLGTWPLRLR